MYHSNSPTKGHHITQAKFSTIDFTDRIVDLLDFSAILFVVVASIGKMKSSIKLYITKIPIIKTTDVEILDIRSKMAIQIQTHRIYSIEFFCFFRILSAIKGIIIPHTPMIQ